MGGGFSVQIIGNGIPVCKNRCGQRSDVLLAMEDNTMKRVLISLPELNIEQKAKLAAAAEGCELVYVPEGAVTRDDVEGAEIIIGSVPAGLLHQPGKLELLQLGSSGADAYVADGILRPGTVLTTCTGAYSQTVAEHAFAATLMLQKNLHLYRDAQGRREWTDCGAVSSINGAVVLVMGLGEIGRYYARMARALGAYVIGVKRRPSAKSDCVDEQCLTEDFDAVAPRADVIVSFLPGGPATTHFYTLERFRAMKPGCIFVNCGRGSAVSAETLEQALRSGCIAAAAVDVFETEPLPAESPLWGLENLLITPHASGFFHLPATLDRVVDICAKNLKAQLTGGELMNVVDFKTGYKK